MLISGQFNGKFYKVQVKRAYVRMRGNSSTLRVNITNNKGSPYSSTEVDIMAIVDVDTHRVWFIPMSALVGQKTVSLTSGKWDRWLL